MKTKQMSVSEAGRLGGLSRSEKKLAAVRKNAEKARAKRAENRQKPTDSEPIKPVLVFQRKEGQ